MASDLHQWAARRQFVVDGDLRSSATGDVLPVRSGAQRAVLKRARLEEERRGGALMTWWNGDGAARVLAHDGDLLLMERLQGDGAFADMARAGRDDEATRIICGVAARLHAPRTGPLPVLLPLAEWFRDLAPAASGRGDILGRASEVAQALLTDPQDPVVLHGDLHHGNLLRAASGWSAIDPKGLHGERGFEFAPLFCNPDAATALAPGVLARRLDIVAAETGVQRGRLAQWVFAYAALSASWFMAEGGDPGTPLRVAECAEREMDAPG